MHWMEEYQPRLSVRVPTFKGEQPGARMKQMQVWWAVKEQPTVKPFQYPNFITGLQFLHR